MNRPAKWIVANVRRVAIGAAAIVGFTALLAPAFGQPPRNPSRVSRLTLEDKIRLLLPRPPAVMRERGPQLPVTPAQLLPPSVDWRNMSGRNYVTPPKDQVGGTCVAFANTAAVESLVLRKGPLQCTTIDLSDRALSECNSGYPADVTTFLTTVGLPVDSCYPYAAPYAGCATACSGWQSKTYKVSSVYHYTSPTLAEFKSLLAQGPVVTGMNVLEGFFGYQAGVYTRPALTISSVTVQTCVAAARQAGYKYAGLQDGRQCFAGNTLGYAKKPETDCNKKCTGNDQQICGGSWRNSVYLTSTSSYQGCYEDRGDRALPVQIDAPQGFHEVQVVGYDDCAQYFIAKNSWGTDWGEGGFFRIAYREFEADPIGFGTLTDAFVGVTGPKCAANNLCDGREDCGSNQLCVGGKCVTQPPPTPQCTRASDCRCTCRPPAVCHAECQRGVCRCLAD